MRLIGGANNSLINNGTIMTADGLDGTAVSDTDGNNTIQNNGYLVGSLDLGTGHSDLVNTVGYVSGSKLGLGTGTFFNRGTFSVAGTSNVGTTELTGSFVQDAGALDLVDVDLKALTADRLNASAEAGVAGEVDLTLLNITTALPGAHKSVIVSGAGGLTHGDIKLNAPVSAIATYSLSQPNPNDLQLNYTIDFSPHFGYDKNQLGLSRSAFGDYIAGVQSAGSSAAFAPLILSIFSIPDGYTLANFYQHLSPGTLAPIELATLQSNQDFAGSMMSCKSVQKSCEWGGLRRIALNQSATENTVGIASLGTGFNYGFQAAVGSGGMSIGGGVAYDNHSLNMGEEVASASGYTLQGGLFASHRDRRGTALSFGVTVGAENDATQRSVAYPTPLVRRSGALNRRRLARTCASRTNSSKQRPRSRRMPISG